MNKASFAIGILAAVTLIAGPAAHSVRAEPATERACEEKLKTSIRDARIAGQLDSTLLTNEHLNPFGIDTKVDNSVVYLSGTVESEIDRRLAAELAASIDGVSEVENALRVDELEALEASEDETTHGARRFRQSIDDATLTARIKTELLVDSGTAALGIDVDVENGVVMLSGSVSSEQERALAEQIAENTAGVSSVDNRLTLGEDEDA